MESSGSILGGAKLEIVPARCLIFTLHLASFTGAAIQVLQMRRAHQQHKLTEREPTACTADLKQNVSSSLLPAQLSLNSSNTPRQSVLEKSIQSAKLTQVTEAYLTEDKNLSDIPVQLLNLFAKLVLYISVFLSRAKILISNLFRDV